MTTQDLCNLFRVSMDKVNITSYPDFTNSEICIFLNQALLSLINTKFTGNNTRKVAFEGDIKRIADLQRLVTTSNITITVSATNIQNAFYVQLPTNFMLFVTSIVDYNNTFYPTLLVTHEKAKAFECTPYNNPWIKQPISYIENGQLFVIYDNKVITNVSETSVYLTYVTNPNVISASSLTDTFQFNDSVAYELINMAVIIALENIESQRMQTKSQFINTQE